MGLLKALGGVVGGAIGYVGSGGNPAAAMAGFKTGSKIGGVAQSVVGSKGSSAASAAPSAPAYDPYSAANKFTKSNVPNLKGDIKVAKTYSDPKQEDKWELTKSWYDDLGGDSSRIDFDSIPI